MVLELFGLDQALKIFFWNRSGEELPMNICFEPGWAIASGPMTKKNRSRVRYRAFNTLRMLYTTNPLGLYLMYEISSQTGRAIPISFHGQPGISIIWSFVRPGCFGIIKDFRIVYRMSDPNCHLIGIGLNDRYVNTCRRYAVFNEPLIIVKSVIMSRYG